VIWGEAPAQSLRGTRLRLSVVSGLDGVTNVAAIADLLVRGGTLRRKVASSLLLRFGTLSPWPVRGVAGGVTAASPR
jgi:hypothetical protein